MKVAVAARDLERPLIEELGERLLERYGRLFLFKDAEEPVWAQNIWRTPQKFKFTSLSEAAKHLRSIQRNWKLHSGESSHRRATLIEQQLPPIRFKSQAFGLPPPSAPLGAWTLLSPGEMLYSAECSSPFPDGEVTFVENKTEPPSRAYLKLWEIFTLEGCQPPAGARVLDLGSSPGGWTWVLDQLGCEVVSVDKAPLSPDLKISSHVKFINESAFALDPSAVDVDWLFCDVICYPERLLELVLKWRIVHPACRFICTLKFQSPTNHQIIREFLRIPGSRVRHLTCNRHELTWILL